MLLWMKSSLIAVFEALNQNACEGLLLCETGFCFAFCNCCFRTVVQRRWTSVYPPSNGLTIGEGEDRERKLTGNICQWQSVVRLIDFVEEKRRGSTGAMLECL